MEQSLPTRPTTMDPIDAAAWAAVLPAGVVVQEGDPPPAPSTFGQGYVLPVHSEKPLQAISAHPLDADLSFEEKSHVYSFRGRPLSALLVFVRGLLVSPRPARVQRAP